ncbi:MAG: NYN domain-containing protein [Rivularia sp. (in: cyanobacteria)]
MNITNFTAQMQPEKQQDMKIILSDEETQIPMDKAASPLTITSNRGRVAIFIDGSNLFHTALQLGIEIDYTKLLCYLTREARLLRAFFYTGVDKHNEKQQGFLLWMRRNGYRVVTKEIVQLPDGSRKSNQHVEIAVDMMNLSPYYDTAVLVSGDGELTSAVNAVAYQGARVELVSLRGMTSESLIDVADCFIDLDAIKHYIKKNSDSCCEEM